MAEGNVFSGTLIREHDDTEKFRFYRISSKERLTGQPYDFEVNLGNMAELNNIGEIHLINTSIPNIMYNISSEIGNNDFTFTTSTTGPEHVLFTDGFYTMAQVLARLESEINLIIAPSVISIAQNEFTKKIVFSITGAETIDYDNTGLNFTLGFTEQTGFASSISASGLPALNGSTMFYIHSTDISTDKTLLNSNSGNINSVNGAFSVPIDVPFGVYQGYIGNENLDRIVYGRDGRQVRGFRMTLRTNGGRLCTELTDNFEWVTTLKVIYN